MQTQHMLLLVAACILVLPATQGAIKPPPPPPHVPTAVCIAAPPNTLATAVACAGTGAPITASVTEYYLGPISLPFACNNNDAVACVVGIVNGLTPDVNSYTHPDATLYPLHASWTVNADVLYPCLVGLVYYCVPDPVCLVPPTPLVCVYPAAALQNDVTTPVALVDLYGDGKYDGVAVQVQGHWEYVDFGCSQFDPARPQDILICPIYY